jgi:hypothetical protein
VAAAVALVEAEILVPLLYSLALAVQALWSFVTHLI